MNREPIKPVLDNARELEPERYELSAAPVHRFEMDRRRFFEALGGGLLVLSFAGSAGAEPSAEERQFAAGERNPPEIGAWIHIGENGIVTVYSGKAEVGQNVRTSLAQAVADELPVASLESVRMTLGDTRLTPYDRGTFGSLSTPYMSPQLRRAAAAARETLIDMAAEQWGVDRETLRAENGTVADGSGGRSIAYEKLVQGRELMRPVPEDTRIKPGTEWTAAGKSVPKLNGRDFVTGKHRYSTDIDLEGMLHGKVLRPPAFGARLVSVDLSAAEAMPGVTAFRDGDFVAVAADSVPAAEKALKAIRAEWETRPQPSGDELYGRLVETAGDPRTAQEAGSARDALARAGGDGGGKRLEARYTIAYIAHTPLEPRAAAAEWRGGNLTVWTGTQRPFGVQSELCDAFRLPEERVRTIVPDTGSGYGGKHTGEAAVEAARIAKEAGRPVKLVWTREEEFTWAYFRPAGVIDVEGAVDADGKINAWSFRNYNSGTASIRTLYDIPNVQVEFYRSDSPLRQGSYRCLAATANNFARESFMDELAHAAGMDPLAFRLNNLTDERFANVLRAAAERFGWEGKTSTPERGFGLAAGFEKNSYTACCAEVSIDPDSGEIKVARVVQAFDCGPVVNPDHMKNQIEGMIVMGIGGALFEAIEFADGKILNPKLSKYRVPRFGDVPEIECVLVDRKDIDPAGGGETPIIVIAPAIANAVFAATGKRLRSMPLALGAASG